MAKPQPAAPDPILIHPGETVPNDTPPGTPIFVKTDGAMFADGCLGGQHYPETNPNCVERT